MRNSNQNYFGVLWYTQLCWNVMNIYKKQEKIFWWMYKESTYLYEEKISLKFIDPIWWNTKYSKSCIYQNPKWTMNEMLIFFKIVPLALITHIPASFPMIEALLKLFSWYGANLRCYVSFNDLHVLNNYPWDEYSRKNFTLKLNSNINLLLLNFSQQLQI